MSVSAGMEELTARMADAQAGQGGGGPGVHFEASAGLDVRLGRMVGLMEQDRARRAALSQMINIVDMPILDYQVSAGVISFKPYRAGGSDDSPQEGLMWFVQRVSLAGLTVGDVVNLHVTVSGAVTAKMTARHTFTCPPGVAAGLGVADWEPGTNGLVLRPDDQMTLVSAGTVTATELILSGQAIQVDLRVLADFLM
jgi:hypothetical protein